MMLATTNHGEKFFIDGKYPRKELLEHFDATHADKMYVDKKSGGTVHIGYIIEGRWIRLYTVAPWEKDV